MVWFGALRFVRSNDVVWISMMFPRLRELPQLLKSLCAAQYHNRPYLKRVQYLATSICFSKNKWNFPDLAFSFFPLFILLLSAHLTGFHVANCQMFHPWFHLSLASGPSLNLLFSISSIFCPGHEWFCPFGLLFLAYSTRLFLPPFRSIQHFVLPVA